MTQRLLASRRDVFASYSLDGFRSAFEPLFEVTDEQPIAGTSRVLFQLTRRP
jgi:hypothetical protein